MKSKPYLLAIFLFICYSFLISSCEESSDGYLSSYSADDEIVSSFDDGDDGWTISGDAQGSSVEPQYNSELGFIYANDNATGGVWYFEAPAKYLGDMEAAYDGKIKFSLKVDLIDSQFDAEDVILEGNNLIIAFDTPNNPGLDWTDYEVVISESAGWTINVINGTPATESQIRSVLSDLTRFRIRGEFRVGYDTGNLNNVEFPGV
ncbi:laminin B domain-containing protein [Bacteroidota bacterium]